jgi:hypothetical protein
MILWYLLEEDISPYTYCNSDTYPRLNFHYIHTRHPTYEDWFRYRLVCRTWKEIMGPYPLVTCSQSPDRRFPKEEELGRVKGIYFNKCKSYSEELEYLRGYPQLMSQVTLLFFWEYPDWRLQSADLQFYKLIEFSNLRSLCIGWISVQIDEDFWLTLSKGCPRLVWLHVHGNMRWTGTLSFPQLEVLGLRLIPEQQTEPSYNIPKLTHFSFTGMILPKQLTHQYGPSLQSLLIHYIKPLSEVTPEFWKHYASLRTFGFYPIPYRPVVGPPPDHPLRHLCIFLTHNNTQRVEMVEATLPKFPHILKLSVEIPNLTGDEKNAVLKIAKRSNVEVHFIL